MTHRIKAIQAGRPRIRPARTVQTDELVAYIAQHTGYNAGDILHMLAEFHDAVVHFNRYGSGVKLEGLGIYMPNIRLDGTLDIQHRLDHRLKRDLNRGTFSGEIVNRENIGKTADELVALWNEAHPDDLVEG